MSRVLAACHRDEALPVAIGALAGTRNQPIFLERFTGAQPVANGRPFIPAASGPMVGVDEPAIDPVDQIRAEAFAQGFDEGMRLAGENMAADQEIRERLIHALEQMAPVANGELSALLSVTVLRLVEQIVGKVSVDPEMLAKRVAAVAAFIEEEQGRNQLRVHPDDIALLAGHEFGIALTPDPAIARGSVRLETSEGWIEDGPDVQLSRLKAMLDTMEGQG